MSRIGLVSLLVADYDGGIAFFVDKLGFDLEADIAMTGSRGQAKRWVVVRPKVGGAGLVLARADSPEERARIGDQTGGRVGFFLETNHFERDFAAFRARGVRFHETPRRESYGTVAVFEDVSGNLWDLIERR